MFPDGFNTLCDLYSFRSDTTWTSNRHERVTRRCFSSSATHGLIKMLESTALPLAPSLVIPEHSSVFTSPDSLMWPLSLIPTSLAHQSSSVILPYIMGTEDHTPLSLTHTLLMLSWTLPYTFKRIHSLMSLERHNSDFGMKWEVLVSCWFMNCGDNSFPSGNEGNRHLLEISVV